jgi:hypothetical protein
VPIEKALVPNILALLVNSSGMMLPIFCVMTRIVLTLMSTSAVQMRASASLGIAQADSLRSLMHTTSIAQAGAVRM